MPHIHTGDGEFDFTVCGFIVYGDTTLLIKHKSLSVWVPPSGHIETTQTPLDALYAEIEEEAGISRDHLHLIETTPYPIDRTVGPGAIKQPLPFDLEVHPITDTHGHINLSYVLVSDTNHVEPGPGESNTFKWFALDELRNFEDTSPSVISLACDAIQIAQEYQS